MLRNCIFLNNLNEHLLMRKTENKSVQREHNFTKRSREGGPFLQAEIPQSRLKALLVTGTDSGAEQGQLAAHGCLSLKVTTQNVIRLKGSMGLCTEGPRKT